MSYMLKVTKLLPRVLHFSIAFRMIRSAKEKSRNNVVIREHVSLQTT